MLKKNSFPWPTSDFRVTNLTMVGGSEKSIELLPDIIFILHKTNAYCRHQKLNLKLRETLELVDEIRANMYLRASKKHRMLKGWFFFPKTI